MNLEEIAKSVADQFTNLEEHPDYNDESVLDSLGGDVTDVEIVWSRQRPMGAERILDLKDALVYINGPESGPTPDEIQFFREKLPRGVKITMQSRATQWVFAAPKLKGLCAWKIQHEAGREDDPEAPVFGEAAGLAVWDLTDISHMRREGRELGHCVGNASMPYWRDVKAGRSHIYSIRDNGVPKMTIEYKDGRINQAQGKSGVGLDSNPDYQDLWKRFHTTLDK